MIEVKNLSFAYGKREILRDVSFKAESGEIVGILGNNGAGKSTLVTCLNHILKPKSGKIILNGKDAETLSKRELAQYISYVAQKNEQTQTTVFDSVLLGRKPYIKWSIGQEDIAVCDEIIERVGLSEMKLRALDELSGGELQKVMLLDEPTSNLDPKNQYEMMKLVRQVADEKNITVLVVIHDLSLAMRFCDKFLLMKDGRVFDYGDKSVLTDGNIYPVYGMHAYIEKLHGVDIVIMHEGD